jgi:hypothetical protein
MQSPFAIFRKHQKLVLAVLGVVAMITFVIGGAISIDPGRNRRHTDDSAVVTWKRGSFNESNLLSMRGMHYQTLRFLDRVVLTALEKKGNPKGAGITRDQQGRIVDPGVPRSLDEESLVRTALLAQKAKELGIVVTDDAILEFLDQLSDDTIQRSDFGRILRETTPDLGYLQLFEKLRTELLAQHMRMIAASGLLAMPPHTAWDYFNRVNRRVKAEVLPLKVADYVGQLAKQPTDAEIQQLYQAGKDRYAEPDSPEPGFKRRHKIAFQYAKAEFDKFLEKEMAAVTQEQVEKYYGDNKKDFVAPELPPAEEKKMETPKDGGAKPGEKPSEPSEKPKDSPPAKADETTKPQEKAAEGKPEAPATPAAPAAGDEKPAAPKPSDNSRRGAPDTYFVSFNAAEEAKPAANTAKPDQPPPADKPVEPKADVPADKPAAGKPPADQPAGKTAEKPAGEGAAVESPKTETKPVKYKPLAEVADQIRRTLARPIAQEKVTQALKEAHREVEGYFREHNRWFHMSKTDPQAQPPKPLDHVGLAERHGLVAGETPLVDELQVADYELGKSYQFSFVQRQVQTIPFGRLAYVEGVPLFKASQIRSFESDTEFLYWKLKEEAAFVPELKDIRDEVANAWKLREALAVAKEAAQKLVQQAKGDKPLKESLDEELAKRVVETNEFSWMTHGSTPTGLGAPFMSAVDGVESPGAGFMEAVAALKPNQVGFAANQPQKVVYVVRVVSETPSEDKRRKQFLETGVSLESFYLASTDRQRIIEQWFQEIDREMQVKWNRPPHEFREQE